MSISSKQVLIIIPAFNEAKIIAGVIRAIKSQGWKQILVIDDGSTDGTGKQAIRAGAKVLSHKRNKGKGRALRTGFALARKLAMPVTVTIDGDGQHYPSDIEKMVKLIDEGQDVVLGYRNFKLSQIPLHKILANKLANLITWGVFGLKVRDSQSGLRAYAQTALNLMKLKYDKYEIESEIIREIKKNQLKWVEVPIRVSYGKHDQSKQDRQSCWSSVKTMLNLIWSR